MRAAKLVAAVVVGLAAVVFVWSSVSTSTARVSATTSGQSAFGAASLALTKTETSAELLFQTGGLYPGLEVEGCVEIIYEGSVPGSLRLHAGRVGGTGLDRFVDISLQVSSNPGSCDSFTADQEVFTGRLQSLWQRHSEYGNGIILADDVVAGTQVALRGVVSLVDSDQAQGLTSEFSATIEVRP
ncbi:MAG: hypothetical protein V3V01_08180 [Acidimicrobiales bacterium]